MIPGCGRPALGTQRGGAPSPPRQVHRLEYPASAALGGARSEAESAEPSEVNT
jgi:hypothetical protein